MIKKFIDKYMERKNELKTIFSEKHPEDYEEIVKSTISILHDENESINPDPERIHMIDDGDYQGTLVFIIGATGYQPNTYWYVCIFYGSCSGCDTLEAIKDYSSNPPSKEQINDYMQLLLHIIQGLKQMDEDSII